MIRYIRYMLSLSKNVDVLPQMVHLPYTVREAVRWAIKSREINQKIEDGYFSDRLVVVPSLCKSASGTLGRSIAAIQQKFADGSGIDRLPIYVQGTDDHNIRLEMMLGLLEGGTVSIHARPSGENLMVLRILDAKYVINFRHPADNMVAVACGYYDANPKYSIDGDWAFTYQHPVHANLYRTEVDVRDKIDYLIQGGYLSTTLAWIAGWLQFRDSQKSIVNRYEDYVADRKNALDCIAEFLYGQRLDDATLARCNEIADGFGRRNWKRSGYVLAMQDNTNEEIVTESVTNKYPYGWSGAIGIRKKYYSKENRVAYISAVEGFLESYPQASLLLDVYPDLLDV